MTGKSPKDNNREHGISEALLNAAFATFDFTLLKSHLVDINFSYEHFVALCGYVRRHNAFIFKYPRPAFERKRDSFLQDIHEYMEGQFGHDKASDFAHVIRTIPKIEHGYRCILDFLDRCDISRLAAPNRASACIYRACYEYDELLRRRDIALAETHTLNAMSGIHIKDDNGLDVSPDAVLEGISDTVAMTLIMEAYKNDWFVNDVVTLPELPVVGELARYQAGAAQMLALCWRQWGRVEKRLRYLGGHIDIQEGDNIPDEFPKTLTSVITYYPSTASTNDVEMYDYLANLRLRDRLLQNYLEMELEHNTSSHCVGIEHGAGLPPNELISLDEVHADVALSELLGYSIAADTERPSGLRLIEWVRGYAVLKELAKKRAYKQPAAVENLAIGFEEDEIIRVLQSCGLSDQAAKRFVDLTCLHRASRDMFDCPLIRVGSSKYVLFAPSTIDMNIAITTLSNLSNRGAELGRKGAAFEESVRTFFRNRGFPVFNFKAKRGGQEYEYDAIVPWDNYLFVFECKNRSLSANDATHAYYFNLELASQAKQILRLADALKTYPDMIRQNLGDPYVNYLVVPCILHSLPYSRSDDPRGICFTDWSAITRFFDQPYFRIKIPYRIKSATLLHRVPIHKMWKGDTPTASDFLEQLSHPFQLQLSMKHLDIQWLNFPISSSELVVFPDLIRREVTARSACEAMGADADNVLKEIADLAENVKTLQSKSD